MTTNENKLNEFARNNPESFGYFADDGITYMGFRCDKEGKRIAVPLGKVGDKGFTKEVFQFLWDCEKELYNNSLNNLKLVDFKYENKLAKSNNEHSEYDYLESVPDDAPEIHDLAFPSNEKTTIKLQKKLKIIIKIKFKPAQKELYELHIYQELTLKEIAELESIKTGNKVTESAIESRWNKIVIKICKNFGVEKPKFRALSEKQKAAKALKEK